MSLGLAVTAKHQRKMSDGRYVADLAALFERRRINLGDAHVCEQFEILLTTSESFRSQLFTLCTAISHMSEEDRTGDELLDMIARALRTEIEDGAALPAALKQNFLAGLDAWNNRSVSGEDEWPPQKKPVASVFHTPGTLPGPRSVRTSEAPAAQPQSPPRPGGIPTLQEALEIARIRGGDRPLRPEPEPMAEPIAMAQPAAHTETNATAIQELNSLLGEIEERMKRLRPQLVSNDAPAVTPPLAEPAIDKLAELGLLRPEALHRADGSPSTRVGSPQADILSPAMPLPVPEERDDAFLARHPYLLNKRPVPVIDTLEPEPVEPVGLTKPQADTELRLMPRNVVELEPVEEKPLPPTLVVPESMKLKTYLAIAVLAGIVLVGTPISAVVAYRYMHPLYIYNPAPPQPDPAAAPQQPDQGTAKPGRPSQGKRRQATRRKPDVAVWPAQ